MFGTLCSEFLTSDCTANSELFLESIFRFYYTPNVFCIFYLLVDTNKFLNWTGTYRYTLDPHYNAVIGRRPLNRVITRTTLYWNEQQKTLVSPSCHIIISLSTDITVNVVTMVNFAQTMMSVLFVSVRHSAHFITNSPRFSLTTWHDELMLYEWLHCWSCHCARCAVDAIG